MRSLLLAMVVGGLSCGPQHPARPALPVEVPDRPPFPSLYIMADVPDGLPICLQRTETMVFRHPFLSDRTICGLTLGELRDLFAGEQRAGR